MSKLHAITLTDLLVSLFDWHWSDFGYTRDGGVALSICDHFEKDEVAFNPYGLFFDKFKVTLEEMLGLAVEIEIRQMPGSMQQDAFQLVGERLKIYGFKPGMVGVERSNGQVIGLPALSFAHSDSVQVYCEPSPEMDYLTSVSQRMRQTSRRLIKPNVSAPQESCRRGAEVTFDGRTDSNAVFGYDEPMQTFFLQAFESSLRWGGDDVDLPLIHFGLTPHEVPSLTFLRQVAEAQGVLFEPMDRQWMDAVLAREV